MIRGGDKRKTKKCKERVLIEMKGVAQAPAGEAWVKKNQLTKETPEEGSTDDESKRPERGIKKNLRKERKMRVMIEVKGVAAGERGGTKNQLTKS